MKILIVCQFYYPEQFSITDVAKGLKEKGHEVFVVTGRPNYGYGKILDGYEKVTDEVIDGIRVHRCPLKPRKKGRLSIIANYISFWRSSKRYLRHLKEEFDVVYSMSLSPLISIVGGTLYAKKHHIRHVLHCLDLWPESTVVTKAVKKESLLYKLLFRWCRKIYRQLDEILISSPSFERYFRETLKIDHVPISYVPQPPQVAAPKEAIEYTHKTNIVYAGNIGTLQLVEQLVEAVDIARKQVDVCLHLIGMGARTDAVKAIIQQRNLSDNVIFHGIQPRNVTAGYYTNASAIVVTLTAQGTVGQTIPSKLNSGLSFGRPILACIQGDGRKTLEESGGAIFAKEETAESLAEAIVALGNMTSKEIEEIGQKNRAYFEAHYNCEKIIDQIENRLKNK